MEATPYQAPLERAVKYTPSHLACLDDASVSATSSLAELRAGLGRPLDATAKTATEEIEL